MLRIFKHFFFAIVNSKVINNNRKNTSLACFNIHFAHWQNPWHFYISDYMYWKITCVLVASELQISKVSPHFQILDWIKIKSDIKYRSIAEE